MLELTVLGPESFDDDNNIFVYPESTTLELEHSLASLSKWEQRYKRPFLTTDKSSDELVEYVKMMCLTPEIPPEVFQKLSQENIDDLNAYLNDTMTATWFSKERDERPNGKVITAEVIYYWLVALQVPFECQYWHLNRLITLIRVINLENAPKKKMGRAEQARQQREQNAARLAQSGSRG